MTFDEMKSFLDYARGGKPQIETLNMEGADWWKVYESKPRVYFWKLDDGDLERVKLEMKTHLGITSKTSDLTNDNNGISGKDESANEGQSFNE